jgi:hypothetical protein
MRSTSIEETLRIRAATLVVAVSVSIAGCATSSRWPQPPRDLREADSVALERTCEGPCAGYRVVLSRTGRVRLDPRPIHDFRADSMIPHGPVTTDSISPYDIQKILSTAEIIGFHALPADIRPDKPMCGPYHTDRGTAIVTIWLPSRAMRVSHYYGCPWAPDGLRWLEEDIDEVTGAARRMKAIR